MSGEVCIPTLERGNENPRQHIPTLERGNENPRQHIPTLERGNEKKHLTTKSPR